MAPKSSYQVYISHTPNHKDEDRFSKLRFTSSTGADIVVVGVYDGHGGSHCAEYVSKFLPQLLSEKIVYSPGIPISSQFTTVFKELEDGILKSLRDTFQSSLIWPMPRSIRRRAINAKIEQEKCRDYALRARSGSTALLAVIEREVITLGSVGDCRAVLGRVDPVNGGLTTIALTIDQNGANEFECERILSEHPASESETLLAGGRLFGHTSTTRSFGDAFFKLPDTQSYTENVFGSPLLTAPGHLPYNEQMSRFYPLLKTPPYLTAVPEVTQHVLSEGDRFLVLASDGIWGIKGVTNEWVAAMVWDGMRGWGDPAAYLMGEVKNLRPGDDVTVIVVVF